MCEHNNNTKSMYACFTGRNTHMHSMAVQHGMPCNYVKEREEDILGGTEGVWLGSSSDDEREEDILGGTEGATGKPPSNPSLTKPAKIMNNC